MEKYSLAISEGEKIITCMDDYINTLEDANFHNRSYLYDMRESLIYFINNNNLTIQNSKPTRDMVNTESSCIDHVTSNCPENIYNIKTSLSASSDHCSLSFNFNIKTTPYIPKN